MSGRSAILHLSITRSSPDISFIMVSGVPGEGGPLDNLQVQFVTLPVFIDIKPQDKRNQINICDKGTLPVAILSYENYSGSLFFDAREIDPMTVTFAGAEV